MTITHWQREKTMRNKNRTKSIGPAGRAGVVLLAVFLTISLGGCDLEQILEVEVPGKVLAEKLDDAKLAELLVNGAIADVECSWNQYAAGASNHSDEYIPTSGNLTMRHWGQRKIYDDDTGFAQGTCGDWGYPMFTPLHTARFQAEDVYNRLTGFDDADVPNKTEFLATVRAWGAFPLIALGEGFCEMAIDGGPLLTGRPGGGVEEVIALAREKFAEAISLAGQAGNDDLKNMALVGSARAKLFLGDYSGAIADAAQVPEGFLMNVTRDDSEPRRYNYFYERLNAPTGFRAHGSIADHFRNLTIDADGRPTQDDGVPDLRVNARTEGGLAADFATILWYHDKYNSRGDPIPIASYKEAQVIMAEAMAFSGDVEGARGVINARRELFGLPTFDLPATQEEMIELVLEERRRELFVEGGHRLNDMLRFRGTQYEIPFLGDPGSIHPDGFDQTGAEYGNLTCFLLPKVEKDQNENIGG
jgi:hypothetical protein